MEAVQLLNYNGSKFPVKNENGILYFNATEMARAFGKKPIHWLRGGFADDFMSALVKVRNCTLTELVQVSKGGRNPCTWMHEDVALEYSRWLSPEFGVWCNDRIKELMNHGITALPQTLDDLANNPDLIIQMATNLKKERAEKERYKQVAEELVETTLKQEEVIKLSAEKVEFHDKVLNSDGLISTNVVAEELGISAIVLNKKLHAWGVIYKQSDTWLLYSQYRGQGLEKYKTYPYIGTSGEVKTRKHMYWTEKGNKFIYELFKKKTKMDLILNEDV